MKTTLQPIITRSEIKNKETKRFAALLRGSLIFLVLIGTFTTAARAGNPWKVPEGTIAYFAFDPAEEITKGSSWSAVGSVLRVALDSEMVDKEFLPLIHALLAAGQVGQGPYTFCLLEIDLSKNEKGKTEIRDLAVVLEMHTRSGHKQAIEAIAAILAADKDKEGREQQQIELPGGRVGVRYRVADQPDWRSLEWCSHEDGFTVGLGKGTLRRWFEGLDNLTAEQAARQGKSTTKIIESHRAAAYNARQNEGKAPQQRLAELFVDIDSLRARMPRLFLAGILPRVLNAFDLGYSRSFMLHASRADRFILLDATYDTRRDPPGNPRRKRLTLAAYPEDRLQLPEPSGRFLVVAEINWPDAYDRVMEIAEAVTDDKSLPRFRKKHHSFEKKNHYRMEAVFNAFKPYVVISDVPEPPLAVPGAATAYFELKEGRDIKRVNRSFSRLMNEFFLRRKQKSLRDVHVEVTKTKEPLQGIWYLQLDTLGLARFPAWGWADKRWMVGSWSIGAVEKNRELLEQRHPE